MEKVNSEGKLFWMRKISLAKARDTLILVHRGRSLRYTDIAREGIRQGVFCRDDGRTLGHSHIYRYIRIPLRLGLLVQDDSRQYLSNIDNSSVASLIKANRFRQPLDIEEKIAFQKLITSSVDCKKAFLWMFVGKEDFEWEDFISQGTPVSVSPSTIRGHKIYRTKKYQANISGETFTITSPVARMAIEWGLQLWALESSLIDEIYIAETKHILYPVNLTQTITFDDYLRAFVDSFTPFLKTEWSFFPLNLLVYNLAPKLRVQVKELQHNFFLEARRTMPQFIKFSSSSKGALTFRSIWDKTDVKVLRNFLKVDNTWVTHMLIHRNVWEAMPVWKH